jgi:hypothetical protein
MRARRCVSTFFCTSVSRASLRAPETSIGELAGEAGEFALYGFIGLILVSWFKRLPYLNLEIPYQLWRLSHRLTGVLFAIVAFHQLFTDKPIAAGTSLSLYLNAFCIAGLCAYAYTDFLAPRLRRREFEVSDIVRRGSVADILLALRSKPLRWNPGQFAFVSSPDAGMSEPHPFTIASAPRETGEIRFAIKSLGGWTQRLSYENHLKKTFGTVSISEIKRTDVAKLRDRLVLDSGPVSSNNIVTLFNRVMNWAVDEGMIEFNPAHRLRKVGLERPRERVLSETEIRIFWQALERLDSATDDHIKEGKPGRMLSLATRCALRIMLLTGQRRAEVAGIRKSELARRSIGASSWRRDCDRGGPGLSPAPPRAPSG